MFIDTHTHLFAEEFDLDRNEMIQRAKNAGILMLILPNIDAETISRLKKTVSENPEICFPLLGLHPCSVNENYITDLKIIREEINQNKPVGIGECGIDLYWDKTFLAEQKQALKIQAEWAKELKLPLIIHARESFEEIFEVLDEINDENLTGIFHCFTGKEKEVEKILNYGGFKLGIGGVVTYKTSHLPALLPSVDLKNIVLETDSPYLPPVPYRGKRNESAYLIKVAEKVAEIYQLPLEKIEEITTNNAKELFKL
jgi:TatD DNase family protein